MSEERQAQELVERWVQARIVPKVVLFLGAGSYTPDQTVAGMFDAVRLHRTNTGQVQISYSNKLIANALEKFFGEKYLVQPWHQRSQGYVTRITPK